MFSDKPTPPLNLKIKEVYKDYVVLTWEAPEDDGGAPILEYIVEKQDVKKSTFINAGTTNGTTCELKVCSNLDFWLFFILCLSNEAIRNF